MAGLTTGTRDAFSFLRRWWDSHGFRLWSIARSRYRLPMVRVFIFIVSKDGFLAEPKTAEQFEFVSSLARVLGGVLERGSCLVDWAC